MSDPKFVKLADRLVRSVVSDINTGWSISGLDVKEFPGEAFPLAQNYVRVQLNRGNLVEATEDEFNIVRSFDGESNQEGHNEADVQADHEANRLVIEASRGVDGTAQLSYEENRARKQKMLQDVGYVPEEGGEDDGSQEASSEQAAAEGDVVAAEASAEAVVAAEVTEAPTEAVEADNSKSKGKK